MSSQVESKAGWKIECRLHSENIVVVVAGRTWNSGHRGDDAGQRGHVPNQDIGRVGLNGGIAGWLRRTASIQRAGIQNWNADRGSLETEPGQMLSQPFSMSDNMYSVMLKTATLDLSRRPLSFGTFPLKLLGLATATSFSAMSRFPTVDSLLAHAVEENVFPGASFGVLQGGQRLAMGSVGGFTYQPESPRVLPESIFDMASVSKAMATTAMAMLLWERGRLDLDEPVGVRLPEFLRSSAGTADPDPAKREITARMLLAHCSGLPAYAPLYERCYAASALLNACLVMPLESPPETRAVYSDIGFIVLGHLLETVAGERLDSYCRREVFAPLGMDSTSYCPPAELKPSIPPTSTGDSLRPRVLQGEVHDNNCWVLGGVSGHAGVFSNIADTLSLAGCFLRGGGTLFRPETISLFTTRQQAPPETDWALGWDTPSESSSSGQFFSTHSVGHLGYTGTSLWIDFEKDLAVVLLTNRTYPTGGTHRVSKQIQHVRPRFHDALMRELGWNVPRKIPPRMRHE